MKCSHCGAANAYRRPYARRAICEACETRRDANAYQQLLRLAHRVAKLNPKPPEIGAGMLASLVEDARNALEMAGEVNP